MISSIDDYLAALRQELRGADPAVIQDAVADASEHLTDAVSAARNEKPDFDRTRDFQAIVEAFGAPAEIARAYREIEQRVPVGFRRGMASATARSGFFSVYRDPRSWTALLYMVLSFVLGCGYLIWAIFGTAASISFSIFLFGIPLMIAFLYSIRGVALIEGRLIETLLGVRMPRRGLFLPERHGWLEQIRVLVSDLHTWRTFFYMSTLWLVAVGYVIVIMFGLAFSFGLAAVPFAQEITGEAAVSLPGGNFWVPRWAYPIPVVAGFLIGTGFLHLIRSIGRWHGRLAKALLVSEDAGV